LYGGFEIQAHENKFFSYDSKQCPNISNSREGMEGTRVSLQIEKYIGRWKPSKIWPNKF